MYVYDGRYGRVAFLANPRTGSKACALALMDAGFQMHGSHHSGLESMGRAAHLDYTSIACVVRGLEDTVQSWCRKLGMTPTHFLREELPRQVAIINGWGAWTLFPHSRWATTIIEYEDLEQELNDWITFHTELDPVELEWVDD